MKRVLGKFLLLVALGLLLLRPLPHPSPPEAPLETPRAQETKTVERRAASPLRVDPVRPSKAAPSAGLDGNFNLNLDPQLESIIRPRPSLRFELLVPDAHDYFDFHADMSELSRAIDGLQPSGRLGYRFSLGNQTLSRGAPLTGNFTRTLAWDVQKLGPSDWRGLGQELMSGAAASSLPALPGAAPDPFGIPMYSVPLSSFGLSSSKP